MKISTEIIKKQIYLMVLSFDKSSQKYRAKDEMAGINMKTSRTEIINYLIKYTDKKNPKYLEIGVRDPSQNFNKIITNNKISVDPGLELKINTADYQMTSDEFFSNIGDTSAAKMLFDIVFIDGLHKAEQAYRDICNSLRFLADDGFIVMHDCNPPTEFHARMDYSYSMTPALGRWNGTTWKAYVKARSNHELSCCCINTDWGVGIITKKPNLFGKMLDKVNDFYEYDDLENNRKKILNLMEYDEFKLILNNSLK